MIRKHNIASRFTTFTSLLAFTTFLIFLSCNKKASLYKRVFSEAEKTKLGSQINTGIYNQGSVSEIKIVHEALKFKPEEGYLWRQLGIPYGKRGFAVEYFEYYDKAVGYDPINLLGYRGYMYMYFYRDYTRALQDFNELDALTPNFVDHPQATSIHYLRAICHLQLEQYNESHSYWDKHFAEEVASVGEAYIDSKAFLLRGITYYKQENFSEAKKIFEKGIEYDSSNADLLYWKAKLAHKQGEQIAALATIKKAKHYYHRESYNDRFYVEEFYQTYLIDIEELEAKIEGATL